MKTPTTPENPSAFPGEGHPTATDDRAERQQGMTLRDWFAGQIMQGMQAFPDPRTCPEDRLHEIEVWRAEMRKHDAEDAYAQAEAMLAAREAK